MDLYRFFRRHDFFYERREGEWNQRSRELRSVGVDKGPGIRKLAQLIASHRWDSATLGPARAKQGVAKLFEEAPYEVIRKTSPELALQLFLVSENVNEGYTDLAEGRKYLQEMKGHANLTLFALTTKALTSAGARWAYPSLTQKLFDQWEQWPLGPYRAWRDLVGEASKVAHGAYLAERRRSGEITMNNFFKTERYVNPLDTRPTTRRLGQLARRALR